MQKHFKKFFLTHPLSSTVVELDLNEKNNVISSKVYTDDVKEKEEINIVKEKVSVVGEVFDDGKLVNMEIKERILRAMINNNIKLILNKQVFEEDIFVIQCLFSSVIFHPQDIVDDIEIYLNMLFDSIWTELNYYSYRKTSFDELYDILIDDINIINMTN